MYKLGILGVGNMGGNILDGILKSSLYNKEELAIYDINPLVIEKYTKLGLKVCKSEVDLVDNVETLILAIKPQMLNTIKDIKFNNKNILIISVVAGKTVSDIKEIFGSDKIIRVMPNTPSFINEGATAIARSKNVTDNDILKAKEIFSQVGVVEEIPDNLMNEIIPVNGSMPAYLYYFVKCFVDKAVRNGIEEATAKRLACQSIIGSAKMILESGRDIDTLIKDVCSPKGATLEGLSVLKENNLEDIIDKASDATINRAYELSKL